MVLRYIYDQHGLTLPNYKTNYFLIMSEGKRGVLLSERTS